MVSLADLLADLHEESADLERMVVGLSDADWQRQTPAAGWTVAPPTQAFVRCAPPLAAASH